MRFIFQHSPPYDPLTSSNVDSVWISLVKMTSSYELFQPLSLSAHPWTSLFTDNYTRTHKCSVKDITRLINTCLYEDKHTRSICMINLTLRQWSEFLYGFRTIVISIIPLLGYSDDVHAGMKGRKTNKRLWFCRLDNEVMAPSSIHNTFTASIHLFIIDYLIAVVVSSTATCNVFTIELSLKRDHNLFTASEENITSFLVGQNPWLQIKESFSKGCIARAISTIMGQLNCNNDSILYLFCHFFYRCLCLFVNELAPLQLNKYHYLWLNSSNLFSYDLQYDHLYPVVSL